MHQMLARHLRSNKEAKTKNKKQNLYENIQPD